jgi:hypothetical protein
MLTCVDIETEIIFCRQAFGAADHRSCRACLENGA